MAASDYHSVWFGLGHQKMCVFFGSADACEEMQLRVGPVAGQQLANSWPIAGQSCHSTHWATAPHDKTVIWLHHHVRRTAHTSPPRNAHVPTAQHTRPHRATHTSAPRSESCGMCSTQLLVCTCSPGRGRRVDQRDAVAITADSVTGVVPRSDGAVGCCHGAGAAPERDERYARARRQHCTCAVVWPSV
jgi:hypothetical protein